MDIIDLYEEYVFPNSMRKMQRYFVFPTLLFLILFSLVLWKDALTHNNNIVIKLCVLVPWSLYILVQLVKQKFLRGFCHLRFLYTENSISNRCAEEEKHILFKDGFYITIFCCEFSIGKGRNELHFYSLSTLPFSHKMFPNRGGLPAMKKLWDQNVLLIPVTQQTEALLSERFGINQFVQYPKVSYFPPQ